MRYILLLMAFMLSITGQAQTPDSLITDSTNTSIAHSTAQTYDTAVIERIDFYQAGLNDAKLYYDGKGPFWGGFASGFILNIGGIVPGGIIAAVPPELNNIPNPNHHLLNQNKEYYSGFKKGAHNKKVGKTAAGVGIGLASFTVIYTALVIAVLTNL